MLKQLAIVALLFCAVVAHAQGTYTAATCSRADVDAVINGPTHTAVDGDVIVIPTTGSCTWTTGITVGSGIGLTIEGVGSPNGTPSTTGASGTCSQTIITDNITSGAKFFYFQPTATSSTSRLSCMKFVPSGTGLYSPVAVQGTCNATTCPKIRLDNLTFDTGFHGAITAGGTSGTLVLTDNVFGVVDHNTAARTPLTSLDHTGQEFINFNNSGWPAGSIGSYGDQSWTSANSYGTANVLYLENNAWGEGIDATETEAYIVDQAHEGGGRIVARFNTCNGCLGMGGNHGTESNGRPRGGRQMEAYGNSFVCTQGPVTGGGCQGLVSVRSGTSLMFGNSLTAGAGSWFDFYISFAAYRASSGFCTSVGGCSPWLDCPGSYDQSSPQICLDQPNRSKGTLLSGSPPTTGWSNEVLDPAYEWDDIGYNPNFGNAKLVAGNMAANTDWFTDNSNGSSKVQTSTTSPFNGTSGVGFGTLANRPTTCTLNSGGGTIGGVGYWATDQGSWNTSASTYQGGYSQGQLYVCKSSNSGAVDVNGNAATCSAQLSDTHYWCSYYTPYTYPHPLIGGSPAVTLSASSHNFGVQNVGVTSGAFTFTVTNSGTATLTFSATPLIGGTNATDFAIGTNTCTNGSTLTAGARP